MDLRSILNTDGNAKASAPPNPLARSASMITEHFSSPPRPQNMPTRSMSIATVPEHVSPQAQVNRSVSSLTETPSLKRSSPSSDAISEPQTKRARTSEDRSPIQPAKPTKRRWAAIPTYARKMDTTGKRFSDVKADLGSDVGAPHETNGRDRTPHTPHSTRGTTPARPLDSLEPNVSGIPAFESARRTICDMLCDIVVTKPDFESSGDVRGTYEIEAKLGKIIDRNSQERLFLPVMTDTILQPHTLNVSFEPSLTPPQYARLNTYLNDMAARSQAPGRASIQYSHPKQVDHFSAPTRAHWEALPAEARAATNPNHTPKLRVTTNRVTGLVEARIIKLRLGDLDLYCPKNEFDIRLSVNLEVEFPENFDAHNTGDSPRSKNDARSRDKDRLSYKHQATQIDLTVVKTPVDDGLEVKREVEVELDATLLRQEGRKMLEGAENNYEKLVGQLLENALVLNRAAVDESIRPG